jgi:hypothetical protein
VQGGPPAGNRETASAAWQGRSPRAGLYCRSIMNLSLANPIEDRDSAPSGLQQSRVFYSPPGGSTAGHT